MDAAVQPDIVSLFGKLTKVEVMAAVPCGTFPVGTMSWADIYKVTSSLSIDLKAHIQEAANQKQNVVLGKCRQHCQAKRHRVIRRKEGTINVDDEGSDIEVPEEKDFSKFMQLPTQLEQQKCVERFLDATSNAALALAVCVVCAHELSVKEGEFARLEMSKY